MRLSGKQKEVILIIGEERELSMPDSRIHMNTIHALDYKKLVKSATYANGEFWSLTDVGLEIRDSLLAKLNAS